MRRWLSPRRRVKDHLPELGAALANQFIRPLGPFGDLGLEGHKLTGRRSAP